MAMNKIPTLILGIGGIGCKIAAGVSDLLSEEDRKYVGIVGLDTNVNDLAALQKKRIKTIQTSDNRLVRDFLVEHPEYKSWFPVSRFIVDKGMLDGAGQIRSISRLAAIAAEQSGAFIPIEEEIKRIRANDGDGSRNTLTVMVVGSITGGTGAGLFLQLPFYIRKHLKHTDGIDSIIIRGMFVSSDITAPVQPSVINKKAVRVNAYACLKELNAFFMTQQDSDLEDRLNIEWYEKRSASEQELVIRQITHNEKRMAFDPELDEDELEMNAGFDAGSMTDSQILAEGNANIPYNYLYLIEASNANGSIGEASIGSVINQISRIVFTYMFTPVKDNALSVEDNFVLQDMSQGGMNRYASAGLCRLVYPKETAQEYVTLCTARDLVKEEWLAVDQEFAQEVITARGQMQTDGTIELPKMQKSFPVLFENAVKNGKLTRLRKETFVVNEMHDEFPRINAFIEGIDELVEERVKEDDVTQAREACTVNGDAMRTPSGAQKEIASIYDALKSYEKLAKSIVSTGSARIANVLFPPSWDGMMGGKDHPNCIYQWMNSVHPLTGRYFCYVILNELEDQIEKLETDAAGIDLKAYENEDFDPKKPNKQTAAEAVAGLSDKNEFFGFLERSGVNLDAKKLRRIRRQLQDNVAEAQSTQISEYLVTNLKLNVCLQLKLRVEELVKNYENFFSGISTIIRENDRQIEQIEKSRGLPLGQKGVYCNAEAMRTMANEYLNKGRNELPPETCTAVFEQLFRVFADDFSLAGKQLTEKGRLRRESERKKSLDSIFQTAVYDTLREQVIKNGGSIIDMNVLEALNKQMELETGITKNSADYEQASLHYIRDQIESAMIMASPMLAVDRSTMAANTETVYLALNPSCAVMRDGEPDVNATQEAYVPGAGAATDGVKPTVLMDEEFSPYAITCLKARYKFLIEDLIKYRPGSENAIAYRERIYGLNRPVESNDPDAFKMVINPHLNRYWHEEGFVPAIDPLQRIKDKEDCTKAFIYGLGLDFFNRSVDDDHLDEQGKGRSFWYVNSGAGSDPVTVCRRHIGNEFADLYKAIPFNGAIKRRILRIAEATARRMKGHYEAAELFAGIMENDFVEDLCAVSISQTDDAELNIFDIFLRMRDQMDGDEWNALFSGLLSTLQEFCTRLFGGNKAMVTKATRMILEKIYEGCATAAKEPAAKKTADVRLEEQYKRILQESAEY